MSLLCFEDVRLSLAGKPVLEGFSAQVADPGFTFIVGGSGAGKSVLCRSAVGLLGIDCGHIELLGTTVETCSERQLLALRRRAPYVVQGPALLDWRTLRQNVALAAEDPAEVSRVLGQFGLSDVADRLPHEVGPGVQKRVALARALVLAPELLLLDEPTTGLDREASRQVTDALEALRGEGRSALVVSHDYAAVSALADRVWVVSGGRCIFSGSAEAFFASGDPRLRALTAPGEAN